jgi:hypothetical protein
MNRDIVKELRSTHSQLAQCGGDGAPLCTRCAAANEIERLRTSQNTGYGFFIGMPPQAFFLDTSDEDYETYLALAISTLVTTAHKRREEWAHETR